MKWHTTAVADIFKQLGSREHGLTQEEVKHKTEQYGRNALPETKTDSLLTIFVRQFASPIIYVLLIAALIVFVMGDVADGAIILAVLVFNAIVGAIQEGRAQNTMRALKNLVTTDALVIRDKQEMVISAEQLVPGDILILKEGDKIPADACLISVESLKVDESALTGESEPIMKALDVLSHEDLQPADQKNMVFSGTYVIGGQGRAVIVSTGIATVIGAISTKLQELNTEVPLKKNIEQLSRVIILTVLIVSVIIFIIGVIRGITVSEMFSTVVAIYVSAIPEGLPVVVTVILAAGMYRMSKRNALVRKLQAVEALGQAKIVAVDKTGTITLNQMMVEKLYTAHALYEISGSGYEPKGEVIEQGNVIEPLDKPDVLMMGKIASLCSTASIAYSEEKKEWQRLSGDPTEAALLAFSQKVGFSKEDLEREHPKLFDIPFSSHTKYHAAGHKIDAVPQLSVIGAPEIILESAKHMWRDGKATVFTEDDKKYVEAAMLTMSKEGLRVIAVAVQFNTSETFSSDNLLDLCLIGLVGISDSIRVSAPIAVKNAIAAGVRVVMITGDHVETAKAIAEKAGIYQPGDEVLTGKQLLLLTESDLEKMLPKVSVFARVAPEDKLKIIEVYRKTGNIVAMTGDGVNDALSLAAADLGVAMGKMGTEVAKEAADIILLDDNFESIVAAIEEGRNIYATIKKVILYLFSTSLGEIFTIGVGIILGYPLPVLASQIIWLNFVTDGFLVAALAVEPKEANLLSKHAKQSRYLLDKPMFIRMVLVAFTMMVGTLILFQLYLPTEGYVKATTVALTTMAVFQWFNAYNVRSDKKSIFSRDLKTNWYLMLAFWITVLLQLLAVYSPLFQKILHTTGLTLYDWMLITAVSLSIIVVDEVYKIIHRLVVDKR
jgi:Ca2+-transporting ATPase